VNPDFEEFDGPLPLFPLPNVVLFPRTILPLHIFEPRYVEMVEDAMKDRQTIGMVRPAPGFETEFFENPTLHRIGCAGRITELVELPNHRYNLKLVGQRKFEIAAEVRRKPYRAGRVRWIHDVNESATGERADAALNRLLSLLEEADAARGEEPLDGPAVEPGTPFGEAINRLVVTSRVEPDVLQALLELRDVYARARRIERILRDRHEGRRRAVHFRKLLPKDLTAN